VRVLYDARLEDERGRRTGFRLAAAIVPPDRLRLESLGPAGGTRLLLVTDGARALAVIVPERRYDVAEASPASLERWTGLPLGPAALVRLLEEGRPCAGEGDDACRGLVFRPPAAGSAAVPPCGGLLLDDPGARTRAAIECEAAEGSTWPRRLRITLPASGRSIELRRSQGPAASDLSVALFSPEAPPGFERVPLLGEGAKGFLLEPPAGDER
jgi:hypothetical protein